jgi:hypothetical protein
MKNLLPLLFAVVLGIACLIPAQASAYYYRGRYYPYYYRGHYYRFTIGAITIDITTTGTITGIGLGSPGHGDITAIGKRWILCGAEPPRLPLLELALVLVRFDHVASVIVNAAHGIM